MNRLLSPTPKFFKKIRNASILLSGIGTAIVTAPITLPVAVATIAGYLVVAGAIAATISQLTTSNE